MNIAGVPVVPPGSDLAPGGCVEALAPCSVELGVGSCFAAAPQGLSPHPAQEAADEGWWELAGLEGRIPPLC